MAGCWCPDQYSFILGEISSEVGFHISETHKQEVSRTPFGCMAFGPQTSDLHYCDAASLIKGCGDQLAILVSCGLLTMNLW